MAIDFSLTEDQTLVLEAVRALAEGELAPRMRDHEKAGAVPKSLRRVFAEAGMDRARFPEELGGLAIGDATQVLVNEALARADAGAAVALQSTDAVAVVLEELAEEGVRARLLAELAGGAPGERWGALVLASELGAAPLVATPSGDGFRLDGVVAFGACVEGAAVTVVAAVRAGADGGGAEAADLPDFFALLGVPEGATVEAMGPRSGLEAAPLYRVRCDGVQVGAADRLGRFATPAEARQALRRLFARLGVHNAARCVGVMDAAWQYARDYASERQAFGKPIGHFQALAFMLADMATLTDASRWLVWRAACALDAGHKRALQQAAEAVAQAYESVNRVAEDALQILGGAGFVQDYPAEKWMRDARSLSLMYGTQALASRALGHELMGSAANAGADELLPFTGLQAPIA